jgi:hypothetical protein
MAIYISLEEMQKQVKGCEELIRSLRRNLTTFARRRDALESEGQTASTVNTSINNLLTDWDAMRDEVVTVLGAIPNTHKFRVKVGQPAAYDGASIVASDSINGGKGTIRVRSAQETTISPFTLFQGGDRVIISNAENSDYNGAWTLLYTPQALGSDIINNGGFASSSNWTESSGDIAISAGVANFTNAVSATLSQAKADMATSWTNDTPYLVSYTVTRAAGSLQVGTTENANYRSVSASGTYEAIVYSDNDAAGLIFTAVGFTGTLDNVSARPWTGLAFTGGIGIDTVSNTFDSQIVITLEER